MARILCGHCHKPIDKIVTSCFERDGSDSECRFPIFGDGRIAEMHLPATWCGWERSEDERMAGIRCPRCGGFPFDAEAGLEASIQVTCLAVPGEEGRHGAD